MNKQSLINRTLGTLEKLPDDKVNEIAEFADFILKKYEDQILQKGIQKIISESDSFSFLNNEEDLYDESDLKVKY